MLDTVIQKVDDRLSPGQTALVVFPVYLVLSLPLSFVTGAFTIIVLEQLFTGLTSTGAGQSAWYGWVVGTIVAFLYASWSAYGAYQLSKETDEEKGAEAVSA